MCNTMLRLTFAVVVLGSLSGCASTLTPELDRSFGTAVTAARARQTINPDASLNTDPVAGMDGEAARAVINLYERSVKSPPEPVNVFTIGVGTESGSGR